MMKIAITDISGMLVIFLTSCVFDRSLLPCYCCVTVVLQTVFKKKSIYLTQNKRNLYVYHLSVKISHVTMGVLLIYVQFFFFKKKLVGAAYIQVRSIVRNLRYVLLLFSRIQRCYFYIVANFPRLKSIWI